VHHWEEETLVCDFVFVFDINVVNSILFLYSYMIL